MTFDLSLLNKENDEEKVLPIACLEGDPIPTVTIKITDAGREKYIKLCQENIYFAGEIGKSEGRVKNDRLALALGFVDIFVIDSDHLFTEGGKPAKHANKAFKTLLIRYNELRTWFLDAVTVALSKSIDDLKSADEATEKNS